MRVVFVLLILFEAVNISSQTKQTKSLVSEIVDQLSLSDDLQANIFSGIYNSNDVRNVLKGNRINYKTFYYNLRSSVNEDFSNTVNYAYSRANFLFDEDEEVIYWLSEYSTYLRGLKNRISNDYSQPNYLAKNNSKAKSIRNKTNSKKNSFTPIVKKVTPKKEIIKELSAENSIETKKITIEDTQSQNSAEIVEDVIQDSNTENSIETKEITIEDSPAENSTELAKEIVQESSAENTIETQQPTTIEETPAENSTELAKEIVQESSTENSIETQQPTIEDTQSQNSTEVVEEILQESSTENTIEPQQATIEDTQSQNSTEVVEDVIQEPSAENTIETQEVTIEDTQSQNSTEVVEEIVQESSAENTIETQQATIEDTQSQNSTEVVEDVIQEPSAENTIETQQPIIEDTQSQNSTEVVEDVIQEHSAENSIETQQPTIEDSPDKNSTEIVEDVIQGSNAIVTPKENTPKKEQPIITNDSNFELSYSAKVENELANKAILYYTVRVKSVSNPTDGLKFLSKIKDNDAVWDEHTFHLFKDKEKENITNITIGKFVDKENAEELMAYLKTKNITNPSIEIHENIIKSSVSNLKPISKPINTTKPRAAIENPVNKVVESTETKKEVSSNKNLLDNISSKVDESENYFSVQVGANNKISSTNIQGLNLNKEKLFFVNIEQGKYAMNYGKHNDYGSAHKIALEIHKKGLETAFVTKYENGVRVKITKNDYLSDKTPKKTISDDINQLGYIPIGPNDKGKFIQIGTIYNWDAHNFKSLYDQLERTIYYKIKENNSVIFLVGPLLENEVFIELRNIKQVISDAFIKTI